MSIRCRSFLLSRVLVGCLVVAGLAASEHHGAVKSAGLPVPGATVSAIQGDKKMVTTTDDQGAYAFRDLSDGVWTIQVEMFGFAKLSREVGIAPEAPSPDWSLQTLSLGALKQELAAAAPTPVVAPVSEARPTPAAATPQPTPVASRPSSAAEGQRPNRPNFGGRGGGPRSGALGAPSLRQAVAQNGFQRANVNASADAAALEAENGSNGSLGNEFASADLNQSASDAFVVNGSVSGGLNLPQQNDWFGFGRGFDGGGGFGPGGPGGPGGFGGPEGNLAAGPGNPDGGGSGGPGFGGLGGGGRGGRGGGGGGGGFVGARGGRGGGRGGRGGNRGGPPNLNAFGNGRRNRRQQYNGNLALILDNSALNARAFSLTGQDTPQAAAAHFRTTAMFGGPLKIPHLISGQNTTFTINFQLARNRNGSTATSLMPTYNGAGDFSQVVNPQTGQPVTLIDPLKGSPFPNNTIPFNRMDPTALNLLKLYKSPNFTGSTRYNFQVPLVGVGNQNNINTRLSHTINAKHQVQGNFAFQNSDTTNPNQFGFVDTNHMTGINSAVQYTYHFKTRLISNLRYNFSRQATEATPYFASQNINVSGLAGIQGNDQAPQFYGPPSLGFSSGLASLSDGNRSLNHNTTNQVGDNLIWIRGSHNVTFGVDYRRLDFNQLSQQNPRGSFSFTGAFTGFDFADFLLGYPGTSSIAYGNADKYFRASWLDAFVNDDWRLNSKLSLNGGLRWDFQAPITELYNRLVNLNVGQNFTSAAPVCGTAAPGCTVAGAAGYPSSLVRPNYLEFQPRIGLAWRPFTKDSTVGRAGYGLYYNTSVYQALATQMAQQSPLSFSVTQANSLTSPYTLANAFLTPAINSTPQTFALDPNFHIGYLHYWQLSVQHNLPASLVATITYNGNKGTHQIQQFLPNTSPAGTPSPLAGYVYETSGANSNYNAVTTQLQRRFRSGFSGNLLYTFSKAIDDAQGVGGRGGGGSAYAQNWLDLAAERSVSSFNRTHTLNMNMQWSTGQGARGGGLLRGWKAALVKDWTVTSTITLGSGLPLTPVVLNRVATGTGITGTVRADYLGGSLAPVTPGYGFNTAAFGQPATGQYGNAGRNIITGPAQFSLNGSAGRVFRIGERRSADLRFDANNALNHVSYTSWNATYGNAQFGLPTSAAAMRTLQASLRLRF